MKYLRYVKNLFRFRYIVIWRYWNTLKYPILVHIEQKTCNNAFFVILGHYGCPGGLLPKSLPVIVHWGRKYFETVLMVKRQSRDMLSVPFSYICHDCCPTTCHIGTQGSKYLMNGTVKTAF